MVTDKEIAELHCEIAELMGWDLVHIHQHSGAARGLRLTEAGMVESVTPNYTGDLNVLLGEFADWFCGRGFIITVEKYETGTWGVTLHQYELCNLFGLDLTEVGGAEEETPQEAAYHAIKQAMPRIKEITNQQKEASNASIS